MSLILEALKKSEAQRRLGEAPNIGTPFAATRRQRSPLPWITLSVVLAAIAGGWWSWRSDAPATGAAPSVSAPGKADASARAAHTESLSARPASAPAAAGATPPPPISVIAPTHPPTPMPSTTASVPATATTAPRPAASVGAPPPGVPPTRPGEARTAAAPDGSRPEARIAVAPDPRGATPPPAAPTKPPVDSRGAAVEDTARASAPITRPPPGTTAPAAPPEPAIPTIDDIASSLRRDLPALPVAMQVYSSDPARRFILVEGERKKEGDMIRDVAVREIRPNGVVLEFRGQRFLLPRPGS